MRDLCMINVSARLEENSSEIFFFTNLKQKFWSLNADLTLKVKVKVTNFLTHARPLYDKCSSQVRKKFTSETFFFTNLKRKFWSLNADFFQTRPRFLDYQYMYQVWRWNSKRFKSYRVPKKSHRRRRRRRRARSRSPIF